MDMGTATIIRADARNLPLPDNSVDLIVTSPPYFALRSYQDTCPMCRELKRTGHDPLVAYPDWSEHTRKFHHYDGQIGSEPTPQEFLDALIEVTRECVRVLKPSGSLFVNLGDKYSGAQAQNFGGQARAGASAETWKRTDPKRTGIPNKSLMGIPWRYALRCIDELGLILRAEVIWSKPNGLPESVTDRVRRSHEQWFHFTREPRYFSAVDEIREPYAPSSIPRRGRGREHVYDAPGQSQHHGLVDGHNPLGALPGSVWTVPTEPLKVPESLGIDHFAAFPTEWPKRLILGWSPSGVCTACGEGRRPVVDLDYTTRGALFSNANATTHRSAENGGKGSTLATITGYSCACPEPTAPTRPAVILDPFGGTGTTAMVAKALGRHGISVDLSADYCRLAEWRTNDRDQLAKVLGIGKSDAPTQEEALF